VRYRESKKRRFRLSKHPVGGFLHLSIETMFYC
jgi:hypothetical protein